MCGYSDSLKDDGPGSDPDGDEIFLRVQTGPGDGEVYLCTRLKMECRVHAPATVA